MKIFSLFYSLLLLFKKICLPLHHNSTERPDGGIGRRAGLKHQWSKIHPGSTPGLGTRKRLKYLIFKYLSLSSFKMCSQNVPEYPSLNMPCSIFIYFLLVRFKCIYSFVYRGIRFFFLVFRI